MLEEPRTHPPGTALVRRARTPDVPQIKAIVDTYAGAGRHMLAKELVTLYENVQDFRVAELDGEVIGCGAVHVLWADLGEVRTVAVRLDRRGHHYGDGILTALISQARKLGLSRLFALTFHTAFFGHATQAVPGRPGVSNGVRDRVLDHGESLRRLLLRVVTARSGHGGSDGGGADDRDCGRDDDDDGNWLTHKAPRS